MLFTQKNLIKGDLTILSIIHPNTIQINSKINSKFIQTTHKFITIYNNKIQIQIVKNLNNTNFQITQKF